MTIPQVELIVGLTDEAVTDLTSVFHRVNNVLPEDQEAHFISFETSVAEALTLMKAKNFSQIPIKAGSEVLGVFSYRSFINKIPEIIGEKVDLKQLQVGDFMEGMDFVNVLEDLTKTLDVLDKKDVVLIGSRDDLKGLLTPIDLVRYLYKLSSPFVLLGEIERALRNIIRSCATQEQLQEMAKATLSKTYQPDEMPKSLEEMTFNDYVQIVGDGRTWKNFEGAFGLSDWKRKNTRTKLEEIRDLRNDTFHFKRDLLETDINQLVSHRDWIKNVLTAYQAKMAGR
ncbi:MAG: CBS domain-containing protein [Anaerolineales bacterium]